jgi:hypothetical protein
MEISIVIVTLLQTYGFTNGLFTTVEIDKAARTIAEIAGVGNKT